VFLPVDHMIHYNKNVTLRYLAAGWMIGSSSPDRGWEFISPPCPDRLWCPPTLLSNVYQGLFLWV